MRWIFLILFSIIFFQISFSATIHGGVYEWYSLEKLNNVIVEIDTSPKQTNISNNGEYIFDVPLGNYTIIAKYYENGEIIYSDSQDINILQEGNFRIDLLMFPVLDNIDDVEFGDELETIDSNLGENLMDEQQNSFILITMLVITLIFVGFLFLRSKKNEKKMEATPITPDSQELDVYAKKVLTLLKNRGNRLTQKEIRDEITEIGEAKISLIITELEQMGKVKKIKKGRGNIVVLK